MIQKTYLNETDDDDMDVDECMGGNDGVSHFHPMFSKQSQWQTQFEVNSNLKPVYAESYTNSNPNYNGRGLGNLTLKTSAKKDQFSVFDKISKRYATTEYLDTVTDQIYKSAEAPDMISSNKISLGTRKLQYLKSQSECEYDIIEKSEHT